METINIREIRINKPRFLAAPKGERNFFIALGYAVSELSLTNKFLLFSERYHADDPAELKMHQAQTLMILNMHASRVYASWELINRHFIQSPLGQSCLSAAPKEVSDSIANMKNFFHKDSNIITLIRSNLTAHYVPKFFAKGESILEIDECALFIVWSISGKC